MPRLLWIDKKQHFKSLHIQIFVHFQRIICDWIDAQKTIGLNFPYSSGITKQEFLAMSDEARFEMCFPGLILDPVPEEAENF